MKKLFLLFAAPFVMLATLTAQITQPQADSIALEYMSHETRPFELYAKAGEQEGFTVVTTADEALELDYSCWAFYVRYTEIAKESYLIIKESSGNVLRVNPMCNAEPEDLADWRIVRGIIPFELYSLEGTSCNWNNFQRYCVNNTLIIINSAEELEQYLSCAEGDAPEIDFANYTLLLINGKTDFEIDEFSFILLERVLPDEYQLKIEIQVNPTVSAEEWFLALLVEKINEDAEIELNVEFFGETYPINISFEEYLLDESSCTWTNLNYDYSVIVINSAEELEQYISCTEGDYPEIDFDNYTLLVASGTTDFEIAELFPALTSLSQNEYEIRIDFARYQSYITDEWTTALIVDKMCENTGVVLQVTPPCNCIMDTLRGDWSWFETYGGIGGNLWDSEFESIIKILSQNEDGSINYVVFVEDTLFSEGAFQIQILQWYRVANIILPHICYSPPPQMWGFLFRKYPIGVPNEKFLCFWDRIIDGFFYNYQKIKKVN